MKIYDADIIKFCGLLAFVWSILKDNYMQVSQKKGQNCRISIVHRVKHPPKIWFLFSHSRPFFKVENSERELRIVYSTLLKKTEKIDCNNLDTEIATARDIFYIVINHENLSKTEKTPEVCDIRVKLVMIDVRNEYLH